MEEPEWLAAEHNPRKKVTLIFDAVVRCVVTHHAPEVLDALPCGPHMTATMAEHFVQQILDDVEANVYDR